MQVVNHGPRTDPTITRTGTFADFTRHRHNPNDREHLLADAEAKRRLVIGIGRSGCVRLNSVGQLTSPQTDGLAVTVLAEIAQIYAKHPDFREEWLIPDETPSADSCAYALAKNDSPSRFAGQSPQSTSRLPGTTRGNEAARGSIMTAGDSALRRADEVSAQADQLETLLRDKRQEAQNYRAAAESERGLSGLLAPLTDRGWHVLEDRRWPGSKRANVDFILIGPPGVIVLDAKNWADPNVVDGRLFRGQSPEDDQVEKQVGLLDSLHDALIHTGLTPSALAAALVFTGRDFTSYHGQIAILGDSTVVPWLHRQPGRLSPVDIESIAAVLEQTCPPIVAAGHVRLELSFANAGGASQDALPGLDDDVLAEAMMASELAGSIEDWMVFLHPAQNRLIRTQWNGAARLSGPAGSGKTTVALHRAAYLALRSREPVLFVSFVRTLPEVLSNLAQRINHRAAESMEFTSLHGKSFEILAEVNRRRRLDGNAVEAAFAHAWRRSAGRSILSRLAPNPKYWKDEIDYVIKGRALKGFEEYASLRRVGRQLPLARAHRELMWSLFKDYEAELKQRGTIDFNDALIDALVAVDDFPELARYSCVLVDEVQDLTLNGLRLLDALSGDGPNRLVLVGDGQQAVYPGGFTLKEAGISVGGRSVVLDRNYRNTEQILQAAHSVLADDPFHDFEESPLASAAAESTRSGLDPVAFTAASQTEINAELIKEIERLPRAHHISPSDTAVLTRTTFEARHIMRLLNDHQVQYVALEDYSGETTPGVKVGTAKRAKGLEFKAVLLPRADFDGPKRYANETDDAYAERRSLVRRELFVAMTRARDYLWLAQAVHT